MNLILNLFSSNLNIAQNKGDLPNRKDIAVDQTWNLADIYATPDIWEKDYKLLESSISKYSEFKGKLGSSASELLNCLKFDDENGIKVSRLYLYSSLAKDLDLGNAENQARYERISALSSTLSAASSYPT